MKEIHTAAPVVREQHGIFPYPFTEAAYLSCKNLQLKKNTSPRIVKTIVLQRHCEGIWEKTFSTS